MANKVTFNLKNVHYAPIAVAADGTVTFSAPVPILGGVSLSLSPEGDTTPFYADGIAFYIAVANDGYSGDLEIALVPDGFRKDVLGDTEDETDKVLVENANVEVKPFALLFQVDGDQKGVRHVMYNCTVTRPNIDAKTTTKSKEPTTEKLSVTAAALSDGRVKAKTTTETPSATYDNWFKTVWQKGAPIVGG